jgi:hypothetical protein
MKFVPTIFFATSLFVMSHPEPGVEPGKDLVTSVATGNGSWTFDTLPGWGALPEGKGLGPTHGSVLEGSVRILPLR